MTPPRVSVVVPFRAPSLRLDECLAHLALQRFRDFDVYLVPDDPLPAEHRHHVVASGRALPNRKRQLAAEASGAEILAFIDDDAYPDPDWLANALPHFADPAVVAAGGPGLTPFGDAPAERAGGAVFASALVTASTRHRYVAAPPRDVDALPSCNLLVRRDAFLRDADASVRYWPGEDILTCMFAARAGARIVYDPAVVVFHHRRPFPAAHLRQIWAYGRFRGHFLRRLRRTRADAVYAAPALFVVAHAVLAWAAARRRWRPLAVLAALTYLAPTFASAQREARAARVKTETVAAGIYLTHLTYGAGTLAGALLGLRRRR